MSMSIPMAMKNNEINKIFLFWKLEYRYRTYLNVSFQMHVLYSVDLRTFK
jgi:hypothetical protein